MSHYKFERVYKFRVERIRKTKEWCEVEVEAIDPDSPDSFAKAIQAADRANDWTEIYSEIIDQEAT